jgi:predicted RNA-binding protein with PUA-like domain
VQARAVFRQPFTLERIKATPRLASMLVIKRGMRLSIQPVTAGEWALILKLGEPSVLPVS